MIKTSIEKMANAIGFDIGNSDDIVQSDLLNGFCEGIYNSMPDGHKREMQICYITDKLTKKSSVIIEALHEFLKTKNDYKDKTK